MCPYILCLWFCACVVSGADNASTIIYIYSIKVFFIIYILPGGFSCFASCNWAAKLMLF